LLLDLIGIPLALGLNQIPMRVKEYMSLMGENYRIAIHEGMIQILFIVTFILYIDG